MSKRVLFYSSVSDKTLLGTQKFYKIDIDILKELGYNVILSNKITDALKFWKYDFVFAYFFRYSFFVGIIARLLWKKVFFTGGIDALDTSYASRREYLIQVIFFKLCYWVCTSSIIVSHSDMNNIKRLRSNSKWRKLNFSEHTIQTKNFISGIEKSDIFTTIGWLGNKGAVSRKGIDTSIKIFARLKKLPKFSMYKFYIIGRFGDGADFVRQLIAEVNLDNDVILTGEVSEDDKIGYLKRSKFYFQPSLFEGFGIAALEAFCAGNTLIHSNKGGLNNPIYANNQIIFDIDKPFDISYSEFEKEILRFTPSDIDYGYIKSYYDNSRRKYELYEIINR